MDTELRRIERRARHAGFLAAGVVIAGGVLLAARFLDKDWQQIVVLPMLAVAVFVAALVGGLGEGRHRSAIAAAKAKEREEARARTPAAVEQRRRQERQAEFDERATIVGSPEWERARLKARLEAVRVQTHVLWRPEYFSGARTPAEREARDLMRRLEREDRFAARAAAQQAVDVRLRQGKVNTPRAAELAMAEWMTNQGLAGVEVCAVGADGGIDITADVAVAQVKFWRSQRVGRPTVQQTYGAAGGQRAIVFAFESGGFSRQAIEWAEQHHVALFTYNENGVVVESLTGAAEQIDAAGWMWRN